MSPEQVEKVTKLIQISPILSQAERGEWLLLLDLMNDKQMNELERILSSGRSPIQATPLQPKTGLEGKLNTSGGLNLVEHLKKTMPVGKAPGPLRLSHIMNLPRAQETKTQPVMQGAEEKKGFLQRLRNAMTEKELPPGETGGEKELPPPSKKMEGQSVSGPALKEKIVPKTLESLNVPKPAFAPKPALKTFESPVIKEEKVNESKRLAEFLAQAKYSDLPPAPLQKLPEVQNMQTPARQITFEKPKIEPQSDVLQPGVKLKDISWGKLSSGTKKEAEVEDKGKEIHLQDPQRLTALSISNLDEFSSHSMISQIKKIVKSSGYHEVIFNLEKSPLYKAYIETGVSILNNKGDLDNIGQVKLPLSRQQFEKFADILRQIQAA